MHNTPHSEATRLKLREAGRVVWKRKFAESGQDGPGYFGRHRRVRTLRGPAKFQVCKCGVPALHWAQVHETDGMDVYTDYVAMCQPCHFAYDEIGSRRIAATTHEQRSARAFKAWETRRQVVV